MDSKRFDCLTHRITTARSRRSLLHDVGATAGAALLARLGLTEVDAKRKRHKRKKRRRASSKCSPACSACQTCQGGRCATAADGTPCGGGMICAAGECVTGQGTCHAGADSCAAFVNCAGQRTDDDCQCQLSIEGDTRCVDNIAPGNSGCGDCGSSAECADLFPDIPGVVCGKGACCQGEPRGLCLQPCPPAANCDAPEDCPDALNACQIRTCDSGKCGRTFVPDGTALPETPSTDGNCHRLVCDGNGAIRAEVDDTDVPCCLECFSGTCVNGTPMFVPLPVGAPCRDDQGQDGLCDGLGHCEA